MSFCPNTNSPQYRELSDILTEENKKKQVAKPEIAADSLAHAIYNSNKGHDIDKAPNGKESVLFAELLKAVGRKEAIRIKAMTYLDSFMNWFGDWTQKHLGKERVDGNGEPRLVGNYFLSADGKKMKVFKEKIPGPTEVKQDTIAIQEAKKKTLYEKILSDNKNVSLDNMDGKEVLQGYWLR